MTFGVPLIQGGQEQQEMAQKLITAVIICGFTIVAAEPVVSWITGFTKVTVTPSGVSEERTYWTSEPGKISDGMTEEEILEHAMPAEVTTIFDKVIMAVKGIAGFVMVIAIVWGGIKLQARLTPSRDKGR